MENKSTLLLDRMIDATVDGRRLLFEVVVTEGTETVAEGRVERILVDRHRFVEKAFAGS